MTSTTKVWFFTGTAGFSNTLNPDPKYGNYSFDLIADEVAQKKIAESGLQIVPKDDGTYRFRRSPAKLVKGSLKEFGPPKTMFYDNKKFTGSYIPRGTPVTVKVVTYPTIKGVGHRLEAIRVDDENFKPRTKAEVDTDIDLPF